MDGNDLVANTNIGVLLASIANSTQSIFWSLCHLLRDPVAYQACLDEIQRVASSKLDKGSEVFTLDELDQLPLLQSAFYESLRRYQALFVTRKAVEDFVLKPKATKGPHDLVEKGASFRDSGIHFSLRQLSMDGYDVSRTEDL